MRVSELRRFMVYQGKQAEIEKRYRILQIRDIRIEECNETVYVKRRNRNDRSGISAFAFHGNT